jgi:hypothetical protein
MFDFDILMEFGTYLLVAMAPLTPDSFETFIFTLDNIVLNGIKKVILLTELYSLYVRTSRYPVQI